ncbi:uncharacterized protein LOC144136696 isoform X1 [Amblyomma americanum]
MVRYSRKCLLMYVFAAFVAGTLLFGNGVYCIEADCNVTLPWNVSQEDHPDIPLQRIEELLRCPDKLHGCGGSPVKCRGDAYAVVCSCARNCELHGNCCWDAGMHLSSPAKTACIDRNVERNFRRDFYAVCGCSDNWPNDEVRSSCEDATNVVDAFYLIPVTTRRNLTYSNAFCALCNYDLDKTSLFWKASGTARTGLYVSPPNYVKQNRDFFFWPCDSSLVDMQTCPDGTDPDIKRKCLTYFAPVKFIGNNSKVVYKNVYCGICNGVDISSMQCVPKQVVPEKWPRLLSRPTKPGRPNLVSLLRPVVSNGSCFSWYKNKCYIKNTAYHYMNTSTVAEKKTLNSSTNTTIRDQPYSVQNYLTIACISLSLICLFLKVAIYAFCKSSRTFSSSCTLCLCGTLFLSHLLFLLGNSFDVSKPVCVGLAVVLHYGFLSTFVWTSVLSFDIWKNIVAVQPSSSRRSGLLLYALIAWGGPLIVTASCVVLNWIVPDFLLSPQYGRFSCWIGSLWSQLTFFLMPMMVLLLLDVGFYVHIVVHVRKTSKRAETFDPRSGVNKSHMGLFVKLAFVMGTTWILGFVGAFVKYPALDMIVIILIGLQGAYLFFGFKDYQNLLPKRFSTKRKVDMDVSTANTELACTGNDLSSREDNRRPPDDKSIDKGE